VPRAGSGVGDQAELGGQHDVVAAAPDRAADEFLVGVRTVNLSRVDESDTQAEAGDIQMVKSWAACKSVTC
jgi:hypothetical protein